jgi:hypothetical protein
MIKVKNILKKDNLMSAAGLGVGSIAAEVVSSKVTPMILKSEAAQKFAPAVPILAGMVIQTGRGVTKSIGHGMIANGVANLAKEFLPATFKAQMGVGAYGTNVMMGVNGQDTLMGTGGSESFDYTASEAGEMDY